MKEIELIIHPGMPKCASSSIQSSLINNREFLRENNIFLLDKNFEIRDKTSKEDPHGIPYGIIYDFIENEKLLEKKSTN